MKKSSFKYYLLISALIFGFVVAIIFKQDLSSSGIATIQKIFEMDREVKNALIENQNLAQSNIDMSAKIKVYEEEIQKTGSIYNPMKEELAHMRQLAGFVPIVGPGIIIILNDSDKVASNGENIAWFLIHDIDILEIVNELRAAGAEDISINDERVTQITSIRCGGPTINIDGKRHATPYIIKAIGDPRKLEASILSPEGYIDLLEYNGIRVTVQKVEKLSINPYIGINKQKYVKIAEEGETK